MGCGASSQADVAPAEPSVPAPGSKNLNVANVNSEASNAESNSTTNEAKKATNKADSLHDGHDGTWDTSFREVEIRGNEGRYLNVWGNLFDLRWQSAKHVEGRFRNVELKNKTGVFEWFFDDERCCSFTGHWKWDGDAGWQSQPWNGKKKDASTRCAASKHSKPLKEALQEAIQRGVPLWNRGDYKGCSEVYKEVAEAYAADDGRLAKALREGQDAPVNNSANSLGWILRRAFDAILSDAGDDKGTVDDAAICAASKHSKPLKEALQEAIQKGVPLWNRGDYKGCSEVYKEVAEAYAADDGRLAKALCEGQDAPVNSSKNSLGWILRRAFDSILSGTGDDKGAVADAGADEQELVQASAAEIEAIQELFDKTWKSTRTRDRRDGKLPARCIVVQAQKNVNPRMLSTYNDARTEITARRTIDERINFLPKTRIEGNLLSDSLERECGEAYFFHGTNPESAVSIAKHDFRLEVAGSNRGAMFGPGIYLAENSSKADEYAKDGSSALYKGIFAMLLCRTVHGKACFVETPGDYKTKVTSGEHDCVIGDREQAVGTYREVILFSAKQVFPEYAVLYRRQMEE